MNKYILLSFLFSNIIIANTSLDQSYYNGNNSYKNNDYISAISFYESIIEEGWESIILGMHILDKINLVMLYGHIEKV